MSAGGDADREAQRQQSLLAALAMPPADGRAATLPGSGRRTAQGLAAYRANAAASAERALAAVFGTVQAMLGADDFKQLAQAFWRAHPPSRGDLAEWGAALPAWLEAHAELQAWPYLADGARVDLARHEAERAADAVLDVASLALLESADPAALRLIAMPGITLLRSRWPIAAIDAAHRPGADAESAFAAVRAALAAQRADAVLVARRGWRAEVHLLGEADAAWTDDVLAGRTLADALDHAQPGFDFGSWLALALRESWLKGVTLQRD